MSKENKSLSKGLWPAFVTVRMFQEMATASRLPQPDQKIAEPPKGDSAEEKLNQVIIENPDMSAATLKNVIKAKGLKVVDEAEGGSTNAPLLRAKESSGPSPVGALTFRARFTEVLSKDDSTGASRFRVVLIQEGLGNLRDGFYYTKEALASGVSLFEGKKIYADHPSSFDEQVRPERSVKDILGHFEDVRLEEADGQSMLTADVVILPDEPFRYARALMRHAVGYAKKFPDKEFVGLSINAEGSAKPMDLEEFQKGYAIPEGAKPKFDRALSEGLSQVKVVERLEAATSCDLVTEAGAGGKVLAMLEQEKKMEEKKIEGEMEKKEAAPHADEEQDIALIKKMIKDYLGDEDSEKEEILKHCKQAMEAYEAMGKSKEEAMKCAGEYLKAAKHMAEKGAKESDDKDADDKPEEKKEESAPAVTGEDPAKKEADEKAEEKVKESLAALQGENARLREALRKVEIAEHVEKVCRESKESRMITDEFKKLVEGAKTKGEIDRLWEAFSKGLGSKKASVAGLDFTSFVRTEKQVEPTAKVSSFAECLK